MSGLPESIAAEQAVIGGLLIDPAAIANIYWLEPSDFVRADHRAIYSAMLDMSRADMAIDACTVSEWLAGSEVETGGLDYLIDLHQNTPSAANVSAYAEIVREKAALRKLIDAGQALIDAGMAGKGSSSRDIAGKAAHDLLELSSGASQRGAMGMRAVGKLWYADIQRRYDGDAGRRLLTPWSGINRLTGGFGDGDLIVLAGRPSMGKSAIALGVALCAAGQGRRGMIFSLEMTGSALFQRAVASLGNVPLAFLADPAGEGEYWPAIAAQVGEISKLPISIDETAGLTIDQIVMRAKREHMRSPLRLVVIDHMHIIALPGKNEVQELGEVSRKSKTLAKALGCPVVLVSQLNRAVEARQNKRPLMADLRGSGSIEQDADQIIFVYRDDYYAQQEGRQSDHPGTVEMIVSKNREGRTGTAWGVSALEYGRIDDHDGPEPERREHVSASAGKLKKGNGSHKSGDFAARSDLYG